MGKKWYTPLLVLAVLLICACSSAPKRPAELTSMRSMAASQLELANKESDRGNYPHALEILKEARRIAVACDDINLLVQTGLAEANVFFYLDKNDEAAADLQQALRTAEESSDKTLAALCKIHVARWKLLGNPHNTVIAGEVNREARANLALLPNDSLNAALGWTVAALAEKELGNFTGAEAALKNALAIHLAGNYLEAAAYDWYLSASVFSMAGNYERAAAAVQNAILLDRRAENSYGLGTDYLALGDIYHKAGKNEEAAAAYRRSAAIFKAARFEKEAASAAKKAQ